MGRVESRHEDQTAKGIGLPDDAAFHEEMVTLLAACDNLIITAQPSGKLNAHRLKTLILLMRYTGLCISDAVSLTTDRLDGRNIF